jgi:hypothetical protein
LANGAVSRDEAPAGDAGVLLQVNPDAWVRRAFGHICRSYPEITTQFNATLKVDGIRAVKFAPPQRQARYQRGMPQDTNGWNIVPKRDLTR